MTIPGDKQFKYAVALLLVVAFGVSIAVFRLMILGPERTTIRIIENAERPAWITGVIASIDQNKDRPEFARRTLCIGIDERTLLITGIEDGAFERGKHLSFTPRLIVDGETMPIDPITNTVGEMVYDYTDEGILIGSHADFTDSCYGIDSIKKGTHSAQFTIVTPLGKEYAYSWEFIVEKRHNI